MYVQGDGAGKHAGHGRRDKPHTRSRRREMACCHDDRNKRKLKKGNTKATRGKQKKRKEGTEDFLQNRRRKKLLPRAGRGQAVCRLTNKEQEAEKWGDKEPDKKKWGTMKEEEIKQTPDKRRHQKQTKEYGRQTKNFCPHRSTGISPHPSMQAGREWLPLAFSSAFLVSTVHGRRGELR